VKLRTDPEGQLRFTVTDTVEEAHEAARALQVQTCNAEWHKRLVVSKPLPLPLPLLPQTSNQLGNCAQLKPLTLFHSIDAETFMDCPVSVSEYQQTVRNQSGNSQQIVLSKGRRIMFWAT
jgi:hypothetical protein